MCWRDRCGSDLRIGRFKDWTDHKATGQQLGIGDDALTQFQLVKHYRPEA
jgi:hypothetical protein